MGQFDIVLQETQMFAADGGYFVEAGYKQAGAVDTQWYEISFLSDGGARALYSGEKQGTTRYSRLRAILSVSALAGRSSVITKQYG